MAQPPPTPRTPRLQDLRFQFQPVVALSDGDGVGTWFEALVRWHLPDGTIQGPPAVLPYWLGPTRRHAFTTFTLHQAARVLAAHPALHLSVNLSPEQLVHPGTVPALRSLRREVRQRLVIELTEQRIHDLHGYWRALEEVRSLCAAIVLDDVSFDDLAWRFRPGAPIDGVKFDRELLPALLGGPRADEAQALLDRVRAHAAVRVAEGVEDPAALARLTASGVSHAQGFGIGAPSAALGTDAPHAVRDTYLDRGYRPRAVPVRRSASDSND